MSPTHTIPHHIAKFALEQSSYDALPPDVIAVSKEMMVNAAAVGLAGAAQQEGLIITRFVQEMGGNGKCTIIGKGLRTSPVYAALANGLMIHLLDFDDEVVSSRSHPGSIIFPAVMAVGEMNGCSGREALAAFALGCELASKLSPATAPDGLGVATGWADLEAGVIGAAAAAGKLLRLDREQLEQALRLASVDPPGLPAGPVAAGLPGLGLPAPGLPAPGWPAPGWPDRGGAYRQGRAAMSGVMAAMLAGQGLTIPGSGWDFPGSSSGGLRRSDEGEDSKYDNNGSDRDNGDNSEVDREAALLAALGNPFDVVNPGVALKLYPCASYAHTAIDTALQLMQQYRMDPEEIASVRVGVTPAALAYLPFPTPANGWEARYCLSYIVAVALIYGHPLIDNFTDAAVQDARVRRMMDRVTVEANETPTQLIPNPASIILTRSDGRQLQHRVEYARGQRELALTPEELDAKFLYCSRYILPPDHIEEAVTRLRDLENIENTTGLFSVLGG